MDIQAIKLELVRQILDLDNPELLKELFIKLRKEDKDFWLELTEAEKYEIELGLKQLERGELIAWETVLKRVS